ncbi:SH3 domain-containing protein [Treponema sp.]|uniref:SH3 domain-containing protein n=1 Tax=Treponema sp. TaxID=166 RepID=UPI0025CD5352|nr:SH3 domain-containing protein [Treponema sp.]MCR5217649.1 SH3 domain-containing protein [Treponema sp.]
MKKVKSLICGFLLLAASFSFAATNDYYKEDGSILEGMYVNSKEGLKIRSAPDLKSERISGLIHGSYVLLREIGKETVIDGITAPWVKIALPQAEWKDYEVEECGWVFGGYLQKTNPLSYKELLELSKTVKYIDLPFFPDEEGMNYKENYSDTWQKEDKDSLYYNSCLENFCNYENPRLEGYVIADCLGFCPAVAASICGCVFYLKAGTFVELEYVVGYGIAGKETESGGLLYPVYEGTYLDDDGCRCLCYIRGIDFVSKDDISTVHDEKGNELHLYVQRALKDINYNTYGLSMDAVSRDLNLNETYESANIAQSDGYRVNQIRYVDAEGNSKKVKIDSSEINFTLAYPLNFKKPLPFIIEKKISEGYKIKIYSLKVDESVIKTFPVCEYEYSFYDERSGIRDYYYFTPKGIVVCHVTGKDGETVEVGSYYFYGQKKSAPYLFEEGQYYSGAPEGNKKVKKVGQFCNPICLLPMHQSPDSGSLTLCLLNPGTLLKIEEVGEKTVIDGLVSCWVKVSPVNDDYSSEGDLIQNVFPAESTSAWVFGAWLE